MLAQVEAWEPPTEDHEGLKTFMKDQLGQSIGADTSYDVDKYRPKRLTGEEYKTQRIEHIARDISYHTENLFGEVDRANDRDNWVQQLVGSVEGWEPVEKPTRYLP